MSDHGSYIVETQAIITGERKSYKLLFYANCMLLQDIQVEVPTKPLKTLETTFNA